MIDLDEDSLPVDRNGITIEVNDILLDVKRCRRFCVKHFTRSHVWCDARVSESTRNESIHSIEYGNLVNYEIIEEGVKIIDNLPI